MNTTEAALTWQKSSYSNGSGGNCVEVATPGSGKLVRDSKNPTGPTLQVDTTAWSVFVDALRSECLG